MRKFYHRGHRGYREDKVLPSVFSVPSVVNYDLRLDVAYRQIAEGKIDCLSIDIFDTLLWRKMPLPVDLFLILGEKLKKEGWLIEAVTVEAFAALRVEAEHLARGKKDPSQEISLQEIYWNLSGVFKKISIEEMAQGKKGIINESDVDDIIAIEVELEKSLIRPDLNILKLIDFALQNGVPVILISDTYFNRSHIEKFLENISSKINRIFLSSELDLKKQHGLFTKVLEELALEPSRMLHIGDNFKSDCLPAQALSIKTIYYQKYDEEMTRVLNLEWPQDGFKRLQMLDGKEGDYGINALRSRIVNQNPNYYWRYGASVLGPILASFTLWVYQRCQEMGVQEIFCLLRQGRMYRYLIELMAPYFPQHKLVAKELWASRQFMKQTALVEGSREELIALVNCSPMSPFTVTSFCQLLGVDVAALKHFEKYRHVRLEDFRFADRLIDYLLRREDLKSKMVLEAFHRRKRYFKYFSEQLDLKSSRQITLLDVGWGGSTQGMLQRLLYSEGYAVPITGLYLATDRQSHYSLLQGFVREGYLLKAGFPNELYLALRRGLYILEQTAASICEIGSLKDIDAQGEFVHASFHPSPKQIEEAKQVQAGLEAFCHLFGSYVLNGEIHWKADSEPLQEQLRQILLRSASLPTRSEAEHFSHWTHDPVSGRSRDHILGKEQYYEKNAEKILPAEREPVDWQFTWPAGYAAKCDENLALATQAVRLKRLPSEAFLSKDRILLQIYVDRGKGFGKKAEQRLWLHSNSNRYFYQFTQLYSLNHPIRGIKLKFGVPLQICNIRMLLWRIGAEASEEIVFYESSYMFKETDIYSVHIHICCEQNTLAPARAHARARNANLKGPIREKKPGKGKRKKMTTQIYNK